MQAVIFNEPLSVSVCDTDRPTVRPGEVLIQTLLAGLCGTDLHIFRNEYMSSFPLTPGHEFVGTVVETAQDVEDFSAGDRVVADPNLYCGRCEFCRNQQHNHCLNWQGVGITRPGALAEYVAVPASACYRVPDSLSDAEAAFIEPVSCVIHALNRLPMQVGESVLVVGAGPMGLLITQAMRHHGAGELVVVDKQPNRLEMASTMGASRTLEASANLTDELRRIEPHGFSVIVDVTGVPEAIEQAFASLRPRGRFLQFGVTPRDATVELSPYDMFHNDWSWIGSFALCYTFQQAIAWMTAGVINVKPLISHRLPLSEFPHALDQFAKGETLKVQFDPRA